MLMKLKCEYLKDGLNVIVRVEDNVISIKVSGYNQSTEVFKMTRDDIRNEGRT